MEHNVLSSSRRLSGVDAAFLYLERKEIPLGIACVCVFESSIPFPQFVRMLKDRLYLIPKWRQVVADSPLRAGYPVWQDYPQFDIRDHIHRVHLKAPGGQAELEELTGKLIGQIFDRSKPLWEITVVDGLAEGRGALIIRTHHSVVDGISGMAMIQTILDPTPDIRKFPKAPPSSRRPEPAVAPSLLSAIGNGIRTSLEHLIGMEEAAIGLVEAALFDEDVIKGVSVLLPEVVGAVERLPFNKPCSGERNFCWAEFDFADVQAIRAVTGGSVNDVVLAVLTGALSRYVQLHGQTIENRLVRIVCPVNLRQETDKSMGNQISFLPVALPMDIADPVERVRAVALRTAVMKKARAANVVALAASCLGVTPPAVQAMLWRGIANVMLPLPLFNMICTNVPGSRDPLYCVGRRMISSYPEVPTGYELGINCAVQTYAGKLSFGLISCAKVAPDATRLRDFLYDAFAELHEAAGVHKQAEPAAAPRKKSRRPRARPVATPVQDDTQPVAAAVGVSGN